METWLLAFVCLLFGGFVGAAVATVWASGTSRRQEDEEPVERGGLVRWSGPRMVK